MNYNEALEYIHGVSWTFCKPGLERIGTLCERLGNPQDSLKFIHVAGTNGKGSFCSMLDSVLRAAGYRVGLYTSPYITEFGERMRVDGRNIAPDTLAEITEYVKPIADSMSDKPTEFELITAIAFEYFKREGCELVILEAGMGGRLDSTNIITTPILSVITGIALDHTAFLGDTVAAIAREKAGIIKRGIHVLFGGVDADAHRVIAEVAEQMGARLYTPDYTRIEGLASDLSGTEFSYKEHTRVKINLLGLYQPRNAALVLEAVDILRSAVGLSIDESAVVFGLGRAEWQARFEIIGRDPLFIFDGAHNPEGICAATESILRYFGDERVVVLSGVLRDKDYRFIASTLSRVASSAVTITPDNPRALTAEEYAAVLAEHGVTATPTPDVESAVRCAVERARREGRAVVCLGSLYTYAEVKQSLASLREEK